MLSLTVIAEEVMNVGKACFEPCDGKYYKKWKVALKFLGIPLEHAISVKHTDCLTVVSFPRLPTKCFV